MSSTTADVKKKRDPNNFINVITNKLMLAKDYHQRIALSITTKRILNHIELKFYIRKRQDDIFLYTRLKDKFGNKTERHRFVKDIVNLVPNLKADGKKGHYTGWILKITDDTSSLVYFMKLISLLSRPKDFYVKYGINSISFYNYPETSTTPIHLVITNTKLKHLQTFDLINTLTEIKPRCQPVI